MYYLPKCAMLSRSLFRQRRSSGNESMNGVWPFPPGRSRADIRSLSSGDTGVSATLMLHGTPPFQVQYRMQKDDEPVRIRTETFPTSRGELTLQPERSGHYYFSFIQMSDANYRKVELHGPSIDQVIHPLAAADFASGQPGVGRNKRTISSCEGDMVDIDVELRVRALSFLRNA